MARIIVSLSSFILSPGSIVRQACLWLAIPIVIFLFGWFNLLIAIIASGALLYALFVIFRSDVKDAVGIAPLKVNRVYWWSLIGIILLLLLCGHGALFYQQWDWQFRNALFFDLARRPWPVTYDADGPELLCYYFAFFLPGALVSKITGLIIPGDIIQFLYAAWGLSIAFNFVCSLSGGKSLWWMLPLMVIFAGADTLVSTMLVSFTEVGEWWPDRSLIFDYYKSFSLFEQLSLIFNQAIPCWVALPLIYAWRKNPEKMLLISSLLFVFAPLPCVGIAVPVTYWCVRGWRTLLGIPLVASILIAVPTGLFYLSNSNAAATEMLSSLPPDRLLFLAIVFLIFGIGIWLPFIWEKIKKNITFWLLVPVALILPFVAVGDSSDLGTRASIPLMLFIFYAVIRAISQYDFRKKPVIRILFLCAVSISAFGAYKSMEISMEGYISRPGKRFEMVGHLDDLNYNPCYNNFIASGQSLYTRMLAPALVVDGSKVHAYKIEPQNIGD